MTLEVVLANVERRLEYCVRDGFSGSSRECKELLSRIRGLLDQLERSPKDDSV